MTTTPDFNTLFKPRVVDRYMVHTPHPVQQIAMSLNNKELLFGGSAGGGKALAIDTPIRTHNGWSTMGELSVGDFVYDENGKLCRVQWKSDIMYNRPAYKVCFSDGSSIVADQDHKWSVSLAGSSDPKRYIKTTGEMKKITKTAKRTKFAVNVAKPLDQAEDGTYLVHPYIYGYWLGDGDTRRGYVTIGDKDYEAVNKIFASYGEVLTQLAPQHYKVEGLTKRLIKMGAVGPQQVKNVRVSPRAKRILRNYIESGSIKQRQSLLQGIVDSDGYVDKDIELTTISYDLAQDYLELILSLGIKATICNGIATLNGREIGPKYRIKFMTDMVVAQLPRKVNRQQTDSFRGTHNKRYIVSITEIESVPVQCIAVDSPNHLYLAGRELIPTHNSDWILMTALQYVDIPGYSALILRRTWPDLNSPGAILERFSGWMSSFPEVHKGDQGRIWTFPSGAKIQFGYAQRPQAKYKFQGAEYQLVAFDEATQFEPEIYQYLLSRLRRPAIPCQLCTRELTWYFRNNQKIYRHKEQNANCQAPLPNPIALKQYPPAEDGTTIFDIPLRMRSSANPGGLSHEFFRERFIDGMHKDSNGKFVDAAFVPSALKDNPSLDYDTYVAQLEGLSLVDRERLLNGDWEIMDSGNLFNRGDFEFVDELPDAKDVKAKVRFWDMAASTGDNADYTVGALCSVTHDGRWFLEDLQRVRALPPQVEDLMKRTAARDGLNVRICAEQEPGSSGKSMISHIKRNVLPGYQFEGIRSTGSKTARANALVSQVSAHNLFVVKADWNLAMLDEMVAFPSSRHDDQVDAVAGGFNRIVLNNKRPVRIIV